MSFPASKRGRAIRSVFTIAHESHIGTSESLLSNFFQDTLFYHACERVTTQKSALLWTSLRDGRVPQPQGGPSVGGFVLLGRVERAAGWDGCQCGGVGW